ncbi:MAG: hypothetical protein KA054_02010 [Candidatus Moranbacteria bacterium]|nr:hypothetical protein [Candidatus Moranbacteria bacterium]
MSQVFRIQVTVAAERAVMPLYTAVNLSVLVPPPANRLAEIRPSDGNVIASAGLFRSVQVVLLVTSPKLRLQSVALL